MTYATGPCLRCNVPVHDPGRRLVSQNRHAVEVIRSTPASEQLARRYQQKLWENMDDAGRRHLDKALSTGKATTGQFMLGSLIATFEPAPKSRLPGVIQSFLAVSGFERDTGRPEHAANQLGALYAAETMCEKAGDGFTYRDLFGQKARFVPGPLANTSGVGSCAAPKLLRRLFDFARDGRLRVQRLEMTEVFVVASDIPGRDRNKVYARVEVAPSCDKCQVLLPQVLCNRCKVGSRNGSETKLGGEFHPAILSHQSVEKL